MESSRKRSLNGRGELRTRQAVDRVGQRQRHDQLAGDQRYAHRQRAKQPQHDLVKRTGHGRRLWNSLGGVKCYCPAVNLRTIHIGASFAIVVVAYGLYGLLVVPWIEPPPPPPSTTSAGGGSSFLPRPNELEQLFDEHSWERGDDANCINSSGQALLLWRKYRTQS